MDGWGMLFKSCTRYDMPTILSISQLATRRASFTNLPRQKSLNRRGKINFDDFVSLSVGRKLFLHHSLIFSSSKMFSQQLFASTIWFIMWLDIHRRRIRNNLMTFFCDFVDKKMFVDIFPLPCSCDGMFSICLMYQGLVEFYKGCALPTSRLR